MIFIGGYPKVVKETGTEYGLPPYDEITFLSGGCNRFGEVEQEPDFELLLEQAEKWAPHTDAIAVVDHQGVANPIFEKKAKELLEERFHIPVICGHELFADYNYIKRGASTLLNAQLIPVIQEFLAAIQKALTERGIVGAVVIMRSDGSLMHSEFAGQRPVETILCGPAASVIGGIHLTHASDCLIVDMGGTTTDVAMVKKGMPVKAKDGVTVGAWQTFVKSVQIDTVGLGGDSIVTRDRATGKLLIGPRRAMPLCSAASHWPKIREELKKLADSDTISTHPLQEYFCLVHDCGESSAYTEKERALCAALKEGPLSLSQAAAVMGGDLYNFSPQRLEKEGIILRCALTATDIMHLKGDFEAFDRQASLYAATYLARCLSMSIEALCDLVYDRIQFSLYRLLVKILLQEQGILPKKEELSRQMEQLIVHSWKNRNKKQPFFQALLQTKAVCVALGAPTHLFLPEVAKALGTSCLTPPYAQVANAVGAIVGNVATTCRIDIKPIYTAGGITGYTVLGEETRTFEQQEDAVKYARQLATQRAKTEARRRGVTGEIQVSCTSSENQVRLGDGSEEMESVLLGSCVIATAKGAAL